MNLSDRIKNVAPSLTLAIAAKAKAMKATGDDVVSLSAGETDFDTPEHIKAAAREAIDAGFTKYTPAGGIEDLKKAVAAKFKRDNNLDYSSSQIVISCGAKHSLYNLIQVLCNSGDEVIIPSPYWVSYPEMVKLASAKPVIVSAGDNLKISPEVLEKSITERTRMLILNSPSNPTGVMYTKAELAELAKVIAERGIYVISDEIYEKLIYGETPHVSIGSLGKDIYDLTITVNGLSKSHSMTGWRIGYMGAPENVAKAVTALQSHSTSNPCSISQKAALAGIEGLFSLEMVEEFKQRRDYCVGRIEGIKNLSCIKPDGAFYIFIDISKTGMGSIEFAERFLEQEKTAVVPGKAFGADDYVRMSFAAGMDELENGMDRMERFV